MTCGDSPEGLAKAAEEFNRHENRKDGAQVAGSLADGLTLLREYLYLRMHQDVEKMVGRDSMLVPVSETKARLFTVEEIEIYQAAESAVAAKCFRYVALPDEWYLRWLGRLSLGKRGSDAEVVQRLVGYWSGAADDRRLAFTDALARVLPESRRAPLVLFRLVPWSVQITTALAFGDHAKALDLRRQQSAVLPPISDCQACRGSVLEIGEHCATCGNPLWKYKWLTSVD